MDLAESVNDTWRGTHSGTRITFSREPLIRKQDRIMTIGSCFALEVKSALRETGFDVYPKYADIEFDPATQHLAKLPAIDDINHYNTYSIRAEFERAFSGERYELVDFFRQPAPYRRGIGKRGDIVWRDPYRRHAYATNEVAILDLSKKIDECVRAAIQQAEVYVITLGMTEAWRNDSTGRFINQAPTFDRHGKAEGFSFHSTSFAENYENVRTICVLLNEHFKSKKIIVTVSPVSFKRTFSGKDLIVANMESKSTLRAVAGAIEKEFENVTYWPSYEIAMIGHLFDERGREVTHDGVKKIVEQFAKVHLA